MGFHPMKAPAQVRLVQPSDARHSVNEVRGVYLESIERLHCRRYKRTVAIDEWVDDPAQICCAHNCMSPAVVAV